MFEHQTVCWFSPEVVEPTKSCECLVYWNGGVNCGHYNSEDRSFLVSARDFPVNPYAWAFLPKEPERVGAMSELIAEYAKCEGEG